MPAHRIGIAPMTPAERQARHRAKLRRQQPDHASSVSAAHPTAAKTVGDGGSCAHRSGRTNTAPGSTLSRPILKDRGWQRS